MKHEIKKILEEAKLAPSVLNSQPWQFRVCGNTIEVYFEKQPELVEIDPAGRLQMASCGSLIAYISNAIEKNGWIAKIDYFPRFEEENLIAFIEIRDARDKNKFAGSVTDQAQQADENRFSKLVLQSEISAIASARDVDLIIHRDGPDRQLQTYFKEKCGRKLESVTFQKHLTMLFRSGKSDPETSFEDEVLLSDRFFQSTNPEPTGDASLVVENEPFLILVTGTDNRYAWTRSGEVLANALLLLKNTESIGLLALPIISKDPCCRDWLREELHIKGYPQFVLKMGDIRQREHYRKRYLQELIKYGF